MVPLAYSSKVRFTTKRFLFQVQSPSRDDPLETLSVHIPLGFRICAAAQALCCPCGRINICSVCRDHDHRGGGGSGEAIKHPQSLRDRSVCAQSCSLILFVLYK
jgi:hypothetical protein